MACSKFKLVHIELFPLTVHSKHQLTAVNKKFHLSCNLLTPTQLAQMSTKFLLAILYKSLSVFDFEMPADLAIRNFPYCNNNFPYWIKVSPYLNPELFLFNRNDKPPICKLQNYANNYFPLSKVISIVFKIIRPR